ncbi:gephyrin-like molybdotransferase receptor GlpR [Streptomyces bobili]|uniref:gephyrin-like molybdotransferase receptor GlpR n=1 Tax=Streptomyces bobili TaxID=67280 RepID=UPI0037931DBF
MSSSGLIYAVIVGAWAAYLVPMWLRRQDELNEARPTERFSTAIRLLSGRAGMERRYAKDLRARSAEEGEEPDADVPDGATDSVDVRAFAMPPARPQVKATVKAPVPEREQARPEPTREQVAQAARDARDARDARESREQSARAAAREQASRAEQASRTEQASRSAQQAGAAPAHQRVPDARRTPSAPAASAAASAQAQAAAARARRMKVLARRRRTTVVLFLAFTLGAIVAAVGGLAFLWAPGVPALLLSGYIAHLRSQERRRFAYQMDRRQAEVAAQRLRERQPRRRAAAPAAHASASVDPGLDAGAEEPHEAPEAETDPGLVALAADRRALVEQTDHAEWVDQQRERQRRPGHGDSWDPVPVPLPTYVTAPVAPRATSDVDLGAPDTWSSARSSSVAPEQEAADAGSGHDTADDAQDEADGDTGRAEGGERTDARRAASARRSRERGRTPLFDQYEDGDRPRAANE